MIVIDNALVAVCEGMELSLTLTVKLKVPGVVGVPLIAPPLDRTSPPGSAPGIMHNNQSGCG